MALQGAFGRAALGITSLVTYIGLGLGVLGSGLALPFGLYILIVQRSPEAVLQDSVTAPSSSRQVRSGRVFRGICLVGSVLCASIRAGIRCPWDTCSWCGKLQAGMGLSPRALLQKICAAGLCHAAAECVRVCPVMQGCNGLSADFFLSLHSADSRRSPDLRRAPCVAADGPSRWLHR
jgi:hypothetical protein